MSVRHNLIYLLIIIKSVTCFDPIGSSSGLHYEPINFRKLRQDTKDKCKRFVSNGHEPFTFIFVNIIGIPKRYAVF